MKVFLATHGRMASGMKSSLDILLGNTDAMTVYDAYVPDAKGTLEENLTEFYNSLPEDEVKLLFCDVYGGSVCQQMTIFAGGKKNTYVIAGVTLGLLMEVMAGVDDAFDLAKLDATIEASREMTMRVIIDSEEKDQGDFF